MHQFKRECESEYFANHYFAERTLKDGTTLVYDTFGDMDAKGFLINKGEN